MIHEVGSFTKFPSQYLDLSTRFGSHFFKPKQNSPQRLLYPPGNFDNLGFKVGGGLWHASRKCVLAPETYVNSIANRWREAEGEEQDY